MSQKCLAIGNHAVNRFCGHLSILCDPVKQTMRDLALMSGPSETRSAYCFSTAWENSSLKCSLAFENACYNGRAHAACSYLAWSKRRWPCSMRDAALSKEACSGCFGSLAGASDDMEWLLLISPSHSGDAPQMKVAHRHFHKCYPAPGNVR